MSTLILIGTISTTIAGTLVIVIPTRDGIIIAADSMASVGGIAIPRGPKLHTVPEQRRTVFTITGTSDFVSPPPPGADLVSWVQHTKPVFSGEGIVRDVLSNAGDVLVSQALLHKLGSTLVQGFIRFFDTSPELRRQFTGQDICQPLLVQYDATVGTSTVARFVVRMEGDGEIVADGYRIEQMGPSDPRYIGKFGETDYVDTHVLKPGSVGWSYLDPDIEELWNRPKLISDMLPENAVRIATTVIRATEKASRSVPIKTAVGGEPFVVLVDGTSRPHEIR